MKLLECLQQRTKSALQCQLRRFLLSRAASRLCSLSSSLIAARRISLFSRSTPKSLDSGGTGISSSPFFSVDEYYLCALRNAVLAADSHGYVDHALAGYCSCLQSPFTISYYKFHILKNSYGEMFVTSSNEQIEQGLFKLHPGLRSHWSWGLCAIFPHKERRDCSNPSSNYHAASRSTAEQFWYRVLF